MTNESQKEERKRRFKISGQKLGSFATQSSKTPWHRYLSNRSSIYTLNMVQWCTIEGSEP